MPSFLDYLSLLYTVFFLLFLTFHLERTLFPSSSSLEDFPSPPSESCVEFWVGFSDEQNRSAGKHGPALPHVTDMLGGVVSSYGGEIRPLQLNNFSLELTELTPVKFQTCFLVCVGYFLRVEPVS